MRYLVTAAAAAVLSAGAAQAAVVDLTYTVEAEVTGYSYSYSDRPYPGPNIGETEIYTFQVEVDSDVRFYREDILCCYSYFSYENFDLATGSIDYTIMPKDDEVTYYNLFEDGSGSILDVRHFNFNALEFAHIDFDVKSWSVEGLPEVAPVPLPASLPLLALGIGGFAALRRRKAGRS